MKQIAVNCLVFAAILTITPLDAPGQMPLGTAFTYQGQLKSGGQALNGTADLQFKLFDSLSAGTQIGTTVTVANTSIANGLFTAQLDFGASVFDGDNRWLQVAVRSPAGSGTYTTLAPRQPVTAAPYAQFALVAPVGHSLDAADGSPMDAVFVNNAGNVGIGTTSPATSLHVSGTGNIEARTESTAGGTATIHAKSGAACELILNRGANSAYPLAINFKTAGTPNWAIGSSVSGSNTDFQVFDYGSGEVMRIKTGSGNVGIGTSDPEHKLEVSGFGTSGSANIVASADGDTVGFGIYGGTRKWDLMSVVSAAVDRFSIVDSTTVPVERFTITESGNVGIGTGTPASTLHVNGTTTTNVLTITGGSDLAEPFEFVEDKIEPGMVVSIDPDHDGKLRLSRQVYDRTVAGVVSGAGGVQPGMTMSQQGCLGGGHPVALAGRVYCLCDASYGVIGRGDLLTTSATPGHAMKVSDYNRATGAILGKALAPLTEGRGLVLILVGAK